MAPAQAEQSDTICWAHCRRCPFPRKSGRTQGMVSVGVQRTWVEDELSELAKSGGHGSGL
jgi:hypothetical protein